MKLLTILLGLCLIGRADTPVFTGEQKAIEKYLTDLFEASKEVNGKKKHIAREKIESSLDWEAISTTGVGAARWKKLNDADRGEFSKLLRSVIVKTAYGRMDKFWDGATYKFEKIEIAKGQAHVVAAFTDREKQAFSLDYYLKKSGSRWSIYDIAFEENRYSENIYEQVDAFLRENSFAKLLGKLKKRLKELG